MDPLTTKDGKPYGPVRFKQIVRERYLITKHTNTSYGDTGKMSPTEKDYLLEFINDDLDRAREAIEESRSKTPQKGRPTRRR